MRLVLANCEIRSWARNDVPSLVRHANNFKIWINLRDRFPYPYTPAHAEAWVRAARLRPELSFAIAYGGEAVGGIGLLPQEDVARRSAEIGYWLAEPVWNRGLATEAVAAFSQWAFDQFDLCRLFAHVFEWNPASARVLEKAGYVLEGRMRRSALKEGRMIDQFLYALVRDEPGGPYPEPPAEPRT